FFLSCHYLFVFLFFFLMLRSHLISTLFPYTTLFRSACPQEEKNGVATKSRLQPLFLGRQRHSMRLLQLHSSLEQIAARPAFHLVDRKSTRLNSSHDQISYAVFCLKKKKKKKKQKTQK